MRLRVQSWCLASICMLGVLSAKAAADGDLLERTLGAHKASREQIRTLSCRIDFELKQPNRKDQTCTGRYWLGPDVVRAQLTDNFFGEGDYFWRDSIRKSVVRRDSGTGISYTANLASSPSRHSPRGDAWVSALLVLNVPGSVKYITAGELVQTASKVNWCKRRSSNGRDSVVVSLHFDSGQQVAGAWDVEIAFDPAANYLIRKVEYIAGSGSVRREEEVQRIHECAPGLFIADLIMMKSNDGTAGQARLSEIKVNEPLPPEVFVFRYPEGITLIDGIRRTRYQVDSQGNRISPETPLARGPAPPQAAEPPRSTPGIETQREPVAWTAWILPLGIAVLVLGLVALVIRRWRAGGR